MPRPKVKKVLAYRKCQQCRKDRQKCSPEGRSWPGRRCDRCQRYGYTCSANKTKDEETAPSNLGDFTRQDAGSEARVTSFSPEPRSLPQGDAQSEARIPTSSPELRCLPQGDAQSEARIPTSSPELRCLPQCDAQSEARYLQKLGDYHQILKAGKGLGFLSYLIVMENFIGARIDDCVIKITVQAQIHQTQGRYKDAEYLCRQLAAASAPLPSDEDGILKPGLDMVLIYEKLGNLPAAEILQEHRLLFSMSHEQQSVDTIISREAENLFRLYILFLSRIEDPNVIRLNASASLTVFYRIAILDCPMLNALLFQSELWTRCNSQLCLHIAIRIHSTEMIRGLISIGVDINKSADNWGPPFLTAARYGNLDSLKLLLANSVDVEAKTFFSETALHLAILRDADQRGARFEVICSLIQAGVDINAIDSYSRTALHSAVVQDPEPEERVVRCLIEAGVDIEAEGWNKETALNLAVRRGYLTTVRLLLQGGADIEVGDYEAGTPLFRAVMNGDVAMAKLLLDHDANIEAEDRAGDTPLHQAVLCSEIELVTMLLDRGASATAYNVFGQTPVEVARSDGDQNLVDLLLVYNK